MPREDQTVHPPIRPLVACAMGISGALFFLVVLLDDVADPGSAQLSQLPWGLILRYVISMGIGGAIAGLLLAGLFGRRGPLGWLLAVFGGLVASAFAGVLGSLVGQLPDLMSHGLQSGTLITIAIGALVLPFALSEWPVLVLVWGVVVGVTHLWVRQLRT